MNTGTTEDTEADLIIGADGAHSKVRKIMTRRPLFNCAQTYIEHGYVELSVPRSEDNEVSIVKNIYIVASCDSNRAFLNIPPYVIIKISRSLQSL